MVAESGRYTLTGMDVTMDVRTGFTAQFLCASALFTRKAREIESAHPDTAAEPTRTEHKGYVTAAVMQSVAALEAESWEISTYGPGHHLGSNGIDQKALAFLQPLADVIDGESVLDRYAMILHLLRKPAFDRGAQPWQDTDLLVRLRNELVHYKSKWGQEMEKQKLFKSLMQLRHPKPQFVRGNVNFFPQECLSAACAAWAVRTAVGFLDEVYARLGITTPLDAYKNYFTGL